MRARNDVMSYSLPSNIQNPKSRFTDTHCHIHDPEFFLDGGQTEYEQARAAGIYRMICVGTDLKSSRAALEFAACHEDCFAAIGIHPHDAVQEGAHFEALCELAETAELRAKNQDGRTLVAIGEIGLDYHYMNSPREAQIDLLEKQIDLAIRFDLPISFHIREAFEDFWPLLRNFSGVRGVLHSFTDNVVNMEKGLENNFFIGVNGIVTFSSEVSDVVRVVPLEKIVLETDAPYLTPKPLRGKINAPGNVGYIASYVAELRGITVEELSRMTESSASRLFLTKTLNRKTLQT